MENIKCLDKGFVRLVDTMGDDSSIVQAARVSYGKGTKSVSEDRGLIRYLMRRWHTTPFEMVEFKFHCKMPIFVARQWVRHRTANINEYSARYSILDNEFYIPKQEHMNPQSEVNNQGRSTEILPDGVYYDYASRIRRHNEASYDLYEDMINELGNNKYNVAREIARDVLPISVYTQWYWKIDLHNLFHFLRLRIDPHAQYEIRVYADAIYELIKPIVPMACEAFEDYRLNSVNLSAQEHTILKDMIHVLKNKMDREEIDAWLKEANLSKRELVDFSSKFNF